jgi:hypothetical protein
MLYLETLLVLEIISLRSATYEGVTCIRLNHEPLSQRSFFLQEFIRIFFSATSLSILELAGDLQMIIGRIVRFLITCQYLLVY